MLIFFSLTLTVILNSALGPSSPMAIDTTSRIFNKCLLAFLLILQHTNARTVISGPRGYKTGIDNQVKNLKLGPPPTKPSDSGLENDWEYWGPHGEHHWEKSFKSCKGKSQSPINIIRERIVYLPDMQLSFINFHRELSNMKLSNNGHTVKLEASHLTGKRFQCFTTGSALFGNTYRFLQLHFHWRNADVGGSEHAIDGEKFSMEMHIVQQNVKYDKETNTESVLRSSDAFTVIAVFFNETTVHNPALDPIIDHLDQITDIHASTIIEEPIRIDSLMPPIEEWNRFYRYSGSYTTPGCQEVVTWIIFPTALNIDQLQMQKFRELIFKVTHHGNETNQVPIGKKGNLLSNLNDHLIGFYRHIQELGNRRIYATEALIPDSGSFLEPCMTILFISFLLTVILT